MKKILLVAVMAASVLSISAQSFEDFFSTEKSNQKITYGVRFGLNIMGMRNNITNNDVLAFFSFGHDLPYTLDIHKKPGVTLGVNVDIPILKNLWATTGLYYSATGMKMNFKQDFSKPYAGEPLKEPRVNLTMHNIRIPVQASYRYTLKNDYQFQVNLGPYFAYGIAGKASVKNDVDGTSMGSFDLTGNPNKVDPERDEFIILGTERINTAKSNYVNPFDMGIAFGMGVTYKTKYFAGFNYDAGLVNVNGKRAHGFSHNKLKNHSFTLVVGYNF